VTVSQSTLLPIIKRHYVKVLVCVAVVAGAAYGYRKVYALPRAALQAEIDASRGATERLEDQLRGQFDIADRMRACGATTLGIKLDEVSARFRDGLSRIAESQGLSAVTVDHGEPADIKNPLLNVSGIPSGLRKALRNPADFSVLRGTVRGTGTVEAALKTLAMAQTQPWIHRVDSFSLKPIVAKPGIGEDRCELRIEVATVFAPEFALKGAISDPTIAPPSPDAETMVQFVAGKHSLAKVLGKPKAVPVVAVAAAAPSATPDAPAPPRQFAPYEDWKLTGIVVGRDGPEAFFVNTKSAQRLAVQKGGSVLDAVFIDGSGEKAVFEIGGSRFEIVNGETLAARRPFVQTSGK